MEFDKLLKLMVEKGASDLFITAGKPPMLKVNGKLYAAGKSALSPEQAKEMVYGVMNPEQQAAFDSEHECNFAINTRGLGRFRVSCGVSKSTYRGYPISACRQSSKNWP